MANEYFSRTPTTSNRTTWTLSVWLKKTGLDSEVSILGVGATDGNEDTIFFSSNSLRYRYSTGSDLVSTDKFLDTTGYYHVVIAADTTNGTQSDRLRFYVNNRRITSWQYEQFPGPSHQFRVNNGQEHQLGRFIRTGSTFKGFMSDVVFVDGQALSPSVFGVLDTDTNSWKPRSPAEVRSSVGNFGTNGYFLTFQNKTSATTLGYDYKTADRSGTPNDWTPNNIALDDYAPEGYSNKFATLNPHGSAVGTFSRGNTYWQSISGDSIAVSNIPVSSGKWYFEMKNIGGNSMGVGIEGNNSGNFSPSRFITSVGQGNPSYAMANNGVLRINGAGGATLTTAIDPNTYIGVAVDLSAGKMWFSRNGTWLGTGSPNPATGTDAAITGITSGYNYYPMLGDDWGSASVEGYFNSGNGAGVTSNSNNGYPDSNGRGKFQYQPPSGFLSICEENITDQNINPREHFFVKRYSGNGGTQSVTGFGFAPDFVMIKAESTWFWRIWDKVRGAWPTGKGLYSNTKEIEGTWEDNTGGAGAPGDLLTSFDADGFTVQSNGTSSGLNQSGVTYNAYAFKAGGTTVVNNNGGVQSTVSVNTTSGFSVVKFTSPASGNFTVGHGIGRRPDLIIAKARNSSEFNWSVYMTGMGDTNFLRWNTIDTAVTAGSSIWGGLTNINNTTISFAAGNGIVGNKDCIAWCWANTPGFSKIGTYTGNTSGRVYVDTGFRPAMVVIKPWTTESSVSTGWRIFDNVRSLWNNDNVQNALYWDTYDGSVGQNGIDFYSNGFSIMNTNGDANLNRSNCTYYYIAFAEATFDYANAR